YVAPRPASEDHRLIDRVEGRMLHERSSSAQCPRWRIDAATWLGRVALGAGLLLAAAPAHGQGWALVWSDEFNGTAVDASNWSFEVGGGGWGNNELEYYRSSGNATVSGGILTITASRAPSGLSCWYGACQYTSARMITRGKREFTYGRIEAR